MKRNTYKDANGLIFIHKEGLNGNDDVGSEDKDNNKKFDNNYKK